MMVSSSLSDTGCTLGVSFVFFFQAEDGIRDADVTGVQTCALPISRVELLTVLRRGGAPQRVVRRLGPRRSPGEAQQTAGHVARGVGGALLDLLAMPRRVGPPAGIRAELRRAVLLVLEPRSRGVRLIPVPLVLQHETLRLTFGVHGDLAATADLPELPRLRLAAARNGEREEHSKTKLRPAHRSLRVGDTTIGRARSRDVLRTGWDSNPRYPCGHTGFRDRPFQPLTHLSND